MAKREITSAGSSQGKRSVSFGPTVTFFISKEKRSRRILPEPRTCFAQTVIKGEPDTGEREESNSHEETSAEKTAKSVTNRKPGILKYNTNTTQECSKKEKGEPEVKSAPIESLIWRSGASKSSSAGVPDYEIGGGGKVTQDYTKEENNNHEETSAGKATLSVTNCKPGILKYSNDTAQEPRLTKVVAEQDECVKLGSDITGREILKPKGNASHRLEPLTWESHTNVNNFISGDSNWGKEKCEEGEPDCSGTESELSGEQPVAVDVKSPRIEPLTWEPWTKTMGLEHMVSDSIECLTEKADMKKSSGRYWAKIKPFEREQECSEREIGESEVKSARLELLTWKSGASKSCVTGVPDYNIGKGGKVGKDCTEEEDVYTVKGNINQTVKLLTSETDVKKSTRAKHMDYIQVICHDPEGTPLKGETESSRNAKNESKIKSPHIEPLSWETVVNNNNNQALAGEPDYIEGEYDLAKPGYTEEESDRTENEPNRDHKGPVSQCSKPLTLESEVQVSSGLMDLNDSQRHCDVPEPDFSEITDSCSEIELSGSKSNISPLAKLPSLGTNVENVSAVGDADICEDECKEATQYFYEGGDAVEIDTAFHEKKEKRDQRLPVHLFHKVSSKCVIS